MLEKETITEQQDAEPKKTEIKPEEKKTEQKAPKNTKIEQKEAVYFEKEFVDNALAIFNVRPECVAAALREKSVSQCTKSEAKSIVNAFMKKEVE